MHEYISAVRVWECTFPGLPEEVGRARRFTRDVLGNAPYAEAAALVVTELATNAVLHTTSGHPAGGTFHLTLTATPRSALITVTDTGGAHSIPQATRRGADDPHGRGLALVEALTHRLTIRGDKHGHTITAELTSEPETREVAAC